jgi:AICAR transformylase/IMP cyclohydrolase PurH
MKIMFVSLLGKTVIRSAAVIFAFTLMAISACNKTDDNACQSSAQVVSAAAAQYAAAQSVANCQLYKAAIVQYLNSTCGASLSSTDKQSFQNILNNLPC